MGLKFWEIFVDVFGKLNAFIGNIGGYLTLFLGDFKRFIFQLRLTAPAKIRLLRIFVEFSELLNLVHWRRKDKNDGR